MIRHELQVAAISLAQVTDSSVRNGSFATILPDLFILLNIGMLLATITQAMVTSPTAKRDYVLVKGSYLLGCRVSEIARFKWGYIEQLPDGAQIHLLGKGAKSRTVRVSAETLALFEALGRTAAEDYVFPSPKRNGPLTRQAIAARMAKWGRLAGVRVHPHKLRHTHTTHSIRRGCDVFTLQNT